MRTEAVLSWGEGIREPRIREPRGGGQEAASLRASGRIRPAARRCQAPDVCSQRRLPAAGSSPRGAVLITSVGEVCADRPRDQLGEAHAGLCHHQQGQPARLLRRAAAPTAPHGAPTAPHGPLPSPLPESHRRP